MEEECVFVYSIPFCYFMLGDVNLKLKKEWNLDLGSINEILTHTPTFCSRCPRF